MSGAASSALVALSEAMDETSECHRCRAAVDDENLVYGLESHVYCSTSCCRKEERENRLDAS